jgi:hypothetical protein
MRDLPLVVPLRYSNGGLNLARACRHTSAIWGQMPAMSISSRVPNLLWTLFWLLVAILLVLLAALLVHHFGGFSLAFHVGYFHFQLGVR